MKKIKLSEIKIPDLFANSVPNPEKVQRYREDFAKLKRQFRLILLDKNGYLRDGYIQYLVLKENNIEEATVMTRHKYKKLAEPISSYKNNETTYIFGIHPNSNCTKEFCWRVPASWGDWGKNIEIGDTVLCQTKNGFAPVVVSRVEVLDKPPVEMRIKRIVKREIRRDGLVVEL